MCEYIPDVIVNGISAVTSFKRSYIPKPENVGVKELLYCLRQSYRRRLNPKPVKTFDTSLKIFRGMLWDKALTSMFPVNQQYVSFQSRLSPARINGKYDFLDNGVVSDLKLVDDTRLIESSKEVDVKQVTFYCVADNKESGQILYFDGLRFKRFMVDLSAAGQVMDCLDKAACTFYYCLVNGREPMRCSNWNFCKGCEFREEC